MVLHRATPEVFVSFSRAAPAMVAAFLLAAPPVVAHDCNENGVDDRTDIAEANSEDCDRNGIPDECELLGAFALGPPGEFPVGQLPHVLSIADLDGDGDLDILATDRASDTISVLRNDGRADFALAEQIVVCDEPRGISSGDVDGDGDLDLVCGCGNEDDLGTLPVNSVLLWEGGLLLRRTDFRACATEEGALRSVSLADLDGDQDLDIVNGFSKATSGGVITVLLGDGLGGFSEALPLRGTDPEHAGLLDAKYLAVGPVDPDPLPDIITYSGQLLVNLGKGKFSGPQAFATVVEPKNAILRDLDFDGDLDALILESALQGADALGILRTFRNSAGRLEESAATAVLPGQVQEGLDVADLDGDGDADVAATYTDGRLAVAVQDEPWTFRLLATSWPLGSGVPRWLVARDFNGDGRPDAAAPKMSDLVAVALNLLGRDGDGDGTLDACEVPFLRGDPDGDGKTSMTDAIRVLGHLFLGMEGPSCRESADANDDGRIDLSDAVRILQYLFLGAEPPPPPGPAPGACSLESGQLPHLGCASYAGCP